MYVSIMERKGIEKGIQLGETRGIQLGRTEGIQLGEARGIQRGRTEGIQLGRTETARNLLRMGLEPAKVAEAASLTIEEVHALRGQADPTQ